MGNDAHPRWLVFDLGGVVIGDVHAAFLRYYAKSIGLTDDEAALLVLGHQRAWQTAKVRNLPNTEYNYWSDVITHSNLHHPLLTPEILKERVRTDGFLTPYPNMVQAIVALAACPGIRVGILSNHIAEETDFLFRTCPELRQAIDPAVILVSGELGLAKPDPQIFTVLEERIRSVDSAFLPSDAVFIDDRKENCERALVRARPDSIRSSYVVCLTRHMDFERFCTEPIKILSNLKGCANVFLILAFSGVLGHDYICICFIKLPFIPARNVCKS